MIFFQNTVLSFNPEVASRSKRRTQGGRRPGAGRPRLFEHKVRVGVDMEQEDFEALCEISETKGRSVPDLIRSAIKTLLKRHRRQ
jgi:hypothetical protein